MKFLLALTAVAALAGAGPAPAARFPTASATNFGVVQLIGETDAGAAVGGVQVFIAAGLDREKPAQSGVSALVAECIMRTAVPFGETGAELPLRDAIAASGASLTYTVDGRSVHYYVEARADSLGTAIGLFGKALATPDFSPANVAAARASIAARANDAESNALTAGIEMFRRAYYADGAGRPALGNVTTLAGLTSADVASFYHTTYKRAAVWASAVGRIAPDVGPALATLAAALPEGALLAVAERAKPIPAQALRIVAHRDIGAPWVIVGFAAPPPASHDFGAMLVLESLLSSAFERDSATTLGFIEKSVGAFYLYDSTPSSLVFYVNGAQVEPTLALRELLVVSRSLSLKPLSLDALQHFKAAAEGQFLTDSVMLSDRSYLLGAFASQGLGTDSINAALTALERTTSADVQRVSKQYLQRYIVALVLPRQSDPR